MQRKFLRLFLKCSWQVCRRELKEYEKLSNQFEMVSVASMIPAYQDRRKRGVGESPYSNQGGRLRPPHYYSPPVILRFPTALLITLLLPKVWQKSFKSLSLTREHPSLFLFLLVIFWYSMTNRIRIKINSIDQTISIITFLLHKLRWKKEVGKWSY